MTSRRLLTPTAQVLLRGADYLEAHGHCKGNFKIGDRVCAIGAIRESTKNPDIIDHAILALVLHLNVVHIPSWNDHPHRTAEEVVDALRAAATHPVTLETPTPRTRGEEIAF